MKRGIWTTKDGRDIPIEEMTDAHLLNTIRFVRRRAKEGIWVVKWWDVETGDSDVDYESGKRALRRMKYKALKAEAKRRGIYEKENAE